MTKTELKPTWNSSSFLVYTGGLTVLFGAFAGLAYLAFSDYQTSSFDSYPGLTGNGEMTAWALLFLVVIAGCATVLRMRDQWIPAGIFAFVAVLSWAEFLTYLFRWLGFHGVGGLSVFPIIGGGIERWSLSRLLFWILVLVAAGVTRRLFQFPLIRLISAVVFWLFLADLLTSGHGSWFAVLTLIVGVGYLLVGNVTDKPSGFWLHLVGGLLIGGPFLYWFRHSDGDYAVISIVALLFVLIAFWTRRSSWAVLGTIGFFAAAGHYVTDSPRGLLPTNAIFGVADSSVSPWAPALAYGMLGFFLVGLGMLGQRNRGSKPVTVAVAKPAVAPTPPLTPPPAEEPPAEEPPAEEPPAE